MLLSYRTKGLFIFEFVIRYKAFMKGKLMNKYGHVTVTKRLTPNLKKRHDFALRLGSIMPDILLHTYIKGHTWDSSYDKIARRLHRLERHGRMNCLSFLSLGYALHYIEDYLHFHITHGIRNQCLNMCYMKLSS